MSAAPATAASDLATLADGLWIASAPVRFLGMSLTSTMTVLRLADGTLLVHSPVPLTPARRTAVDALGCVAHLYAPNLFHHLHLGEWTAAYPAARLHAPEGLAARRPDLRIDRLTGTTAEPAFAATIDEIAVEGFRLAENVLFHRPTRTLVVADLVHNVGRPAQAWAQCYTRLMGFHDRVALSRMIRWIGFADRRAARRSLDRVLALPFERLVVGHGLPVTDGARAALAEAYAWLPAAP